tara:strand:+ start:299 stop:1795 length:1497 start_codon:yes stop_codon:yes gene_type:complete
MKVLLTFTGFHDPFSSDSGNTETGPVLTALSEVAFDRVFLFSTPRMQEFSSQTLANINSRGLCSEAEILSVEVRDPTDYRAIISSIRTHFRHIVSVCPEGEFTIVLSSGTPQIHACWLMLVASGEIPARLLQTFPRRFAEPGKSLVREVDLSGEFFPRMTLRERMPVSDESGTSEENLLAARVQIGLVGEDPAFLKAVKEASIYSGYDEIDLLLLGETGTGKERFTELVHLLSERATKPLVTVNCSSIPTELVESHLFGHKKGAFTGAASDQPGKFTVADGGILFLDELGELPLSAQAKLLRVLENGEIEPVGHATSTSLKVNVRVIAATNRNLREMVAKGSFREDLYQRFDATVRIPSLRERRSDIPLLCSFLLEDWNRKHKRQHLLTPKALSELMKYDWPGNIRELRKVITQSAMLTAGKKIDTKDLRFELPIADDSTSAIPEPEEGFSINGHLEEIKRRLVHRALEKENGVQARAAKLLGWSPQGLGKYLKTLDR